MNKRLLTGMTASAGTLVALALAVGLVRAPNAALEDPTAESVVGEAARSGVPTEGIQVHGHWVIEVENPDGSVASRHAFENALTADGAKVLPIILAKEFTQSWSWWVRITGDQSLCNNVEEPGLCYLAGPDLTVESVNIEQGEPGLVFRGTVVADLSANVVRVTTGYFNSEWVQLGRSSDFTSKDLSGTPIPVGAGQSVNVTVRVTFT